MLRYQVEAKDNASGEVLEPIVTGRVFPNLSAAAIYMRDKLAPLAARMRRREEVAAFAPAALIEPLNMVVYVWPIDGELPSLVDATDRQHVIAVFRETLPAMLEHDFVVEDCAIERVSYRRRQRCVLRYTIAGRAADCDEVRRLVVYGKLTAGGAALTSRMLDALRDQIRPRGGGRHVTLPRSFGYRPDLQLSLLEALPGQALIGPALKARLRGKPPPAGLSVEEMIATCGEVAAMLHTSNLQLGRRHTLDDELIGIQHEIATTRQFVPDFADQAQFWLARIAALADQSEPLTLCLNHGDFKPEQLLFDGASSGLVDFDTLCQAEPALDLGKFLADFRLQARKMHKRASGSSALSEELAEQFLHAYVNTVGDHLTNERQLRLRVLLYECISLLRLALRSQHDFNETRLRITTALLEERMS